MADVGHSEPSEEPATTRAPWIIVAAATPENGIGYAGAVPWRLPGDLAFFRRLTMITTRGIGAVNAVLMGRRTWDSLPRKPLRGRLNIVLTCGPAIAGALTARSLDDAQRLATQHMVENVLVIGGGRVYEDALRAGLVDAACVTRVLGWNGPIDTYMPNPETFDLVRVAPVAGSALDRAANDLEFLNKDDEAQGSQLSVKLECFLHQNLLQKNM